jgi:hypothetical protein
VKSKALFAVYVAALIALAGRLQTVLHECAHAVVGLAAGMRLDRIDVSLLGGGTTWFFPDDSAGTTGRLLMELAGMATDLVAGGAIVWAAVRLRGKRPMLDAALTLWGGASMLSVLSYLAMGLYSNWGDPANAAWTLGGDTFVAKLDRNHAWLVPLLVMPVAAYPFARRWVRLQERFFPTERWLRRGLVSLVTLGSAVLMHGIPVLLAGKSPGSGAPSGSPRGIVIGGAIAWMLGLAGVVALRSSVEPRLPPAQVTLRPVLLAVGAAALVLGVLALLGQRLV